MAINATPPAAPTILVNGVARGAIEEQTAGSLSVTCNREPVAITGPAVITMTGPAGATIRYTFNAKKVNLGSTEYAGAISVPSNGNGFDSDTLTVRAKSYVNGEVSGTTEVRLAIQ